MRILYFTNLKYLKHLSKDIEEALKKLGHNVLTINDQDFKMDELITNANICDMFLFHQGGVSTDNEYEFRLSLARLHTILQSIKTKKTLWFVDKVWGSSDLMMESIVSMVDWAFINDDTWVRRHKYPNVSTLHCGVGKKRPLGKFNKELECDIAFIGKVYGTRTVFVENLRQQFGRRFKVFQGVHDKEFDDLCQSVKIIVSPNFPMDDFYWSNRIYKILGCGGFLIHPRLFGLKEEGFIEGKHYVGYKSWNELLFHLDHFLKPENHNELNSIAQNGRDFVHKNFNYIKRLKELLSK